MTDLATTPMPDPASSGDFPTATAPGNGWAAWGAGARELARSRNVPLMVLVASPVSHDGARWARDIVADSATWEIAQQHTVPVLLSPDEHPVMALLCRQAHLLLRRSPGGDGVLVVFLSPAGLPFFSTANFALDRQAAADDTEGPPALADVIMTVDQVWRDQRDALGQQDAVLQSAFAKALPQADGARPLDAGLVASLALHARAQLLNAGREEARTKGRADLLQPCDLQHLLWCAGGPEGDTEALRMAIDTVVQATASGLHDQLGGGFFRAGLSGDWMRPRFEKRLDDNAMMVAVLADAVALAARTPDLPAALLLRTLEDTVAWVLRDLWVDGQGWRLAVSSDDKRGRDGAVYLWQPDEWRKALPPAEFDLCAAHWGLVDVPLNPPVDDAPATWHLRVARSVDALSAGLDRPAGYLRAMVESAREKLLKLRDEREPAGDVPLAPTSAQALMVAALWRAARATDGRPEWTAAARTAMDVLRSQRWQDDAGDGQPALWRVPGIPGTLDDVAQLLSAVLEALDVAPAPGDLAWALQLAALLTERHEDFEGGGWWAQQPAAADFHNPKPALDGALPSGNGTAALALVRLAERLDDLLDTDDDTAQPLQEMAESLRGSAAAALVTFGTALQQDPASHTQLLRAATALCNAGKADLLSEASGAAAGHLPAAEASMPASEGA